MSWKEGGKAVHHSGGAFYSLGLIGAFIYYWPSIHGFGDFLIVIIKSILWPAFLTIRLYEFLGMN